jgi:hypothetical protein
MSVAQEYYKKHFQANKFGYVAEARRDRALKAAKYEASPEGVRARVRALITEGQEYQAFRTLVDSATSYFEEKRNAILDLPIGSGERSTVEAALGLLAQANSGDDISNHDLRARIQTLRDGLREVTEGMDNEAEVYIYVKTTVDSLADLFTQVSGSPDDGGGEDLPPVEDEPAPPAPDEEEGDGPPPPDGGGEEEEPIDDLNNPDTLAQRLGLV